jgi:hypothetical protein
MKTVSYKIYINPHLKFHVPNTDISLIIAVKQKVNIDFEHPP